MAKAQQLLAGVREEAALMMLFLKHVSSIEVWDWAPGAAAPALASSCSVGNSCEALNRERALFTRASADALAAGAAAAAVCVCLHVDVWHNSHGGLWRV